MSITLYLTSRSGGTRDMTEMWESVQLSGDKASLVRKLSASVVYKEDSGLPVPDIGDGVTLTDESGTLFVGYIVQRTLDSESYLLDFTAYDKGVYLVNNDWTGKFKLSSAESIVSAVCADVGVPVKSLASTGATVSRKFSGVAIDKIIKTAYTLASQQTGDQYAIRMDPDGLVVKVKDASGSALNLKPKSNLERATTTESIVNMVNSVAIYSKDGELLGSLDDSSAIGLYGQMQRHITQSSSDDDSWGEAQTMLEDGAFDRSITVECIGDRRLITGETVVVEEDVTNLTGVFWIDSDVHTWKRNLYTCKLTLNCRSVMTKTEAGTEYE